VSFRQLYYTSCEHGVGGYAGFQFNAVSQGVGARVMREVEQLTVYELPSWDSSRADAPVNLCHAPDVGRGDAIIANCVYAGTDFSGRAGNYFAHALFTEEPAKDFGELLPIELWESPMWVSKEVRSTALPTIAGGVPRGSIDRPTVAKFLSSRADAHIVAARLLSAVDKVISEGRSLILWSSTSTENAHWIAALSFLLAGARAREMSFCTYTRRPARSHAHVIGTVPGAVTSPAALTDSFRVFDMTSGAMPDVETHPLADLLVQVGVLHAAGLWRQAATLAAGTERSFDEWYPVASAAAGLRGTGPLPASAVTAIAGWLPRAAVRPVPLSGARIEMVLTVLLDRHDDLRDEQLQPLLPIAKAAGAMRELQRIEIVLVNRSISRLQQGLAQDSISLTTSEGIQLAVTRCERLLGSANAPATVTVLDWARKTGLSLDAQLVERCGREVVGPALATLADDRRVVQVGEAYPAFVRGLGDSLVASGPESAVGLLRGVVRELLGSSELRNHPQLREMWLLYEVSSGELRPMLALGELIELRPAAAPALSDEYLLARLWPYGLTTVGEAAELLDLLDTDVRGTRALELLDRSLQPPGSMADADAWLDLCAQTMAHQVYDQLPVVTRQRLKAVQGFDEMLDHARHSVRQGDTSWYEDLHYRIERLPHETRDLLRRYLAHLTLAIPQPAEQLERCSEPVFGAACVQARIRLETDPRDHQLAARLFHSVRDLRSYRSPRAHQFEEGALVPTIPRWSRRDQYQVASILKWQGQHRFLETFVIPGSRARRRNMSADLSGDFQQWCERNAPADNSGGGVVSPFGSVIAWIRGRRRPGPE
jgi:hypothetical protein